MAHPLRIQRKRTKGWRLPEGAVCVTRPGKWGNPFRVGEPFPYQGGPKIESPKVAVEIFESYLVGGLLDVAVEDVKRELRGKQLACWCNLDKPCHADVLATIANS